MRLFIAVEISDEIKAEITRIIDRLKAEVSPHTQLGHGRSSMLLGVGVKWVKPEGMHLTLKFLGEVGEERKEIVENILEKVSIARPFTVTFQGLGAFPNQNNPRVVWMGIEKGREELKKINYELEKFLAEAGFPKEEREYEAHLTLGRVKSGQNKIALAKTLSAEGPLSLLPLKVEKISLIESILKREGAEYRRVKEIRLGCHCEER